MTAAAYVDTSWLVAIGLEEPGYERLVDRLAGFDTCLSSTLLEAELRSVEAREGVRFDRRLLSGMAWVLPDRRLTEEIRTVLDCGYVRGPDLWHLACALYLRAQLAGPLSFLSADRRQQGLARELGLG